MLAIVVPFLLLALLPVLIIRREMRNRKYNQYRPRIDPRDSLGIFKRENSLG